MLTRKEKWNEFLSIRFTVYFACFINIAYALFIKQGPTLCDQEGYSCFACGMRTAFYHLAHGNVQAAIESNSLVVVVLLLLFAMGADSIYHFMKRAKKE